MTELRALTLPFIAGATLLVVATPAIAQQQEIVVTGQMDVPDGYEPVSKKVDIGELDLATEAGATEMENRVAAAVDSICSEIKRKKMRNYCSDYAWASARPQMDEALEKARGG